MANQEIISAMKPVEYYDTFFIFLKRMTLIIVFLSNGKIT